MAAEPRRATRTRSSSTPKVSVKTVAHYEGILEEVEFTPDFLQELLDATDRSGQFQFSDKALEIDSLEDKLNKLGFTKSEAPSSFTAIDPEFSFKNFMEAVKDSLPIKPAVEPKGNKKTKASKKQVSAEVQDASDSKSPTKNESGEDGPQKKGEKKKETAQKPKKKVGEKKRPTKTAPAPRKSLQDTVANEFEKSEREENPETVTAPAEKSVQENAEETNRSMEESTVHQTGAGDDAEKNTAVIAAADESVNVNGSGDVPENEEAGSEQFSTSRAESDVCIDRVSSSETVKSESDTKHAADTDAEVGAVTDETTTPRVLVSDTNPPAEPDVNSEAPQKVDASSKKSKSAATTGSKKGGVPVAGEKRSKPEKSKEDSGPAPAQAKKKRGEQDPTSRKSAGRGEEKKSLATKKKAVLKSKKKRLPTSSEEEEEEEESSGSSSSEEEKAKPKAVTAKDRTETKDKPKPSAAKAGDKRKETEPDAAPAPKKEDGPEKMVKSQRGPSDTSAPKLGVQRASPTMGNSSSDKSVPAVPALALAASTLAAGPKTSNKPTLATATPTPTATLLAKKLSSTKAKETPTKKEGGPGVVAGSGTPASQQKSKKPTPASGESASVARAPRAPPPPLPSAEAAPVRSSRLPPPPLPVENSEKAFGYSALEGGGEASKWKNYGPEDKNWSSLDEHIDRVFGGFSDRNSNNRKQFPERVPKIVMPESVAAWTLHEVIRRGWEELKTNADGCDDDDEDMYLRAATPLSPEADPKWDEQWADIESENISERILAEGPPPSAIQWPSTPAGWCPADVSDFFSRWHPVGTVIANEVAVVVFSHFGDARNAVDFWRGVCEKRPAEFQSIFVDIGFASLEQENFANSFLVESTAESVVGVEVDHWRRELGKEPKRDKIGETVYRYGLGRHSDDRPPPPSIAPPRGPPPPALPLSRPAPPPAARAPLPPAGAPPCPPPPPVGLPPPPPPPQPLTSDDDADMDMSPDLAPRPVIAAPPPRVFPAPPHVPMFVPQGPMRPQPLPLPLSTPFQNQMGPPMQSPFVLQPHGGMYGPQGPRPPPSK